MLLDTIPDYATIYKQAGKVDTAEISFCNEINKTIFKLRIFNSKFATIEEVRLTDYNKAKNMYMTVIGSKFTDIEGLKNVRAITTEFLNKSREITFNQQYSNYKCDVYYK